MAWLTNLWSVLWLALSLGFWGALTAGGMALLFMPVLALQHDFKPYLEHLWWLIQVVGTASVFHGLFSGLVYGLALGLAQGAGGSPQVVRAIGLTALALICFAAALMWTLCPDTRAPFLSTFVYHLYVVIPLAVIGLRRIGG